jgi:hypothetical protein
LALAFTANGIGLDGVIELVVSEEVATRRLLARRVHQPSGRIYNLDTCPPQKSGVDDVRSPVCVCVCGGACACAVVRVR